MNIATAVVLSIRLDNFQAFHLLYVRQKSIEVAGQTHINWVTSDTNARDDTLMETRESLEPSGGHTIGVLKEGKTYLFIK